LYIFLGTKPRFPRDLLGGTLPSLEQIKLQKESVMGGLYLGVAVTGAEALVAMALVIAFM
jgi:hypothetical protein